jgi:hypothetical protein
VKRLNLPRKLERQLSTTNAIENVKGSVRNLGRRVKRWHGGAMIVRCTVIADAARRFPPRHQRAQGYDRARAGTRSAREAVRIRCNP